jgi:hypothetical protein
MANVSVEIDERWVRIARSPLYWIVATLQGVSVTFAPLFLYWSGRGMFPPRYQWIIAPACFAVIYLIGLFYMRLGGAVVAELRRKPAAG